MRVLMLTNMYPHEADRSFGTFVYEQVRALRALGVDIDVLFINGRASRLNYLAAYPRLWRQLRHVRYDLIHAHYVFSGMVARAQWGLPIVQSFHAPGQMHTYQGWLCRRLVPLVDAVIVTSEDHKARLGYEGAHIIPCGVDFELFAPRPQAEARAALGWDPERKVVLWVGDPRPEKRVDLAHATYEVLRRRRDDVDLRVVSKVPHDSVPTYMNAGDVLLLTSDHEGSPVVIKEAMACNLPIVATAVGDVPQVLAGVEGCYLAEQSPDDFAAKVELALALNGRTRGREAIQHLQTNVEAQTLVGLYEQVLARRRAGRAAQ
ncbi:MAG: glycosyltransferase family 4 protein [Chloroflexi bacterium]|jgi:teichuronic acid biosynthesis glycosyltransferase TuaC|nr:glycosyltransferase family 4 protein [Chloroflexota bacterium]